jgi:flagellar hook-associated protein 1 FlgK
MGSDLLSIGKSALHASKKSLATSSHNIANANTEGYSRQRVNLQTNPPIGVGNHVLGNGVDVKSVKRIHDDLVEKRLNSSIANDSFNKERAHELGQIEEIFNEINSEGMNKIINRFFNSFRELANQPENETVRSVVRENARIVASDFKRQIENLNIIENSMNRQIDAAVTDINQMINQIAKLNKEITSLEVTHQETGDLRDQRDGLLRSLSEYFAVNAYESNNGQFVVSAKGVGTLVAGTEVQELKSIVAKNASASDLPQNQIYLASKPNQYITDKFQSGKIEALFNTRAQELADTRASINELAYNIVEATNAIHSKGHTKEEAFVDELGNVVSRSGRPTTGINFFQNIDDPSRAAEAIDLSDEVRASVNNIVTALDPNSPGDNRVALALSKLQHEKIMAEGTTSFEEHYLKSVGNIGLVTAKVKLDAEQSEGLLAQAKSVKERISGVSIDEETANMVKYQQAYEASARVIKVSDEMFKSVLNMVGN